MTPIVKKYTKISISDDGGICKMRIDQLVNGYVKFNGEIDKKEMEKEISKWKKICK